MSHLLSHLFSFLTTLVATRRRHCLLRSAWVNVMPEWLLSVISGILLGGSPVSALSFVASFTLLYGPLVFFWVVFVLFLFWPYSWWHTRCHRASHFSELVAIPLLCVLFSFGVVVFWCVLFVCLPFLACFVFDGIAHWTVYWSITSAFEAIDG